MMVMTAKVDLKKILIVIGIIAALLIAAIRLFGGSDAATATSALPGSSNDSRVQFLQSFGWEVTTSPVESSQVKIPKGTTEVFERYNSLQKSQGYNLADFAGKNVMRYVYQINNYPGATEPVYATLLVYKNHIIGGDITDTAPGGRIQGFQKSGSQTAPAETGSPTQGTT